MIEKIERPQIGLGVYILKNGHVLIGKRCSQTPCWAPPGGHMEMYESLEDTAKRETEEETGLKIDNIRFMTITNDIFKDEGKHYITIHTVADWVSGEPELREPDKCSEWIWPDWDQPLPQPLFKPIEQFRKLNIDPRSF